MSQFNVVFLGVGIMPHRVAGDKNFILDLAAYLRRCDVSVQLVSIAEPPPTKTTSAIPIQFIPRFGHPRTDQYYHVDNNQRVIGYHHQHHLLREYVELCTTLLAARQRLKGIIRSNSRTIVHWVDLSLALPVVRVVCGVDARYVCSALRYVSQGRVGNVLRAQSIKQADITITSTQVAKERLTRDGGDASRIVIAPWGIHDAGERRALLQYGDSSVLPEVRPVRLLWAGFIQQIGEADLLRALDLAGRVTAKRSDIEFTFSLKPESFKSDYLAFQRSGIKIVKGTARFAEEFYNFDALFSPVLRMDSTVAPPLTWIESLAAGLPIITTALPGVTELLVNGESAQIFDDYAAIEAWLMSKADIGEQLRTMKIGARQQFERLYCIEEVGARYLDIYQRLWTP